MITNKKWQELLMLATTVQNVPEGTKADEFNSYEGLIQDVKDKPKGAYAEIPL